jgi:hypothetical protein
MAQVIVSLLAQSDTASVVADLAGKAGDAVAAKIAADFERSPANSCAVDRGLQNTPPHTRYTFITSSPK